MESFGNLRLNIVTDQCVMKFNVHDDQTLPTGSNARVSISRALLMNIILSPIKTKYE